MKIHHMLLAGIGVKIFTLGLGLLAANTYGALLLDMDKFPDWANKTI